MPYSVAHEILGLLVERHPELLVGYDVESHLQHFGDDLVPGLVDCLNDSDPDVRRLAVGLLVLSRPHSDVALPLIIERLSDEDRQVRLSTLWALTREFKPLPREVIIPHLEKWLDYDDTFERINAMAGISTADPDRREFLPELWEALSDEFSMGQEIAMEFFGDEYPEPTEDEWARLIAELDDLRRPY
jgi:HEAT repeat protein